MKLTSKSIITTCFMLLLTWPCVAQVQLEGIVDTQKISDPQLFTEPAPPLAQQNPMQAIQPQPVAQPISQPISQPIGSPAFGANRGVLSPRIQTLQSQLQSQNLDAPAQAIVDGLTSAIEDSSVEQGEVVTERYDNRKVKTERQVVQDKDQNYINHGKYKTYDPKGKVTVEGRYKYGEMDGVWTRLYYSRETELLNKAPFNQGQLPLVSQANFTNGKLNGKWVIYDALKRRLCEWEFTNGKRDGVSTWWYATGTKMREITYREGTIDGQLNEWDRNAKQVTKDVYVKGSSLATKTESFANRTKRAEGSVLYPKLVLESPDDWIECRLATYSQDGQPVKYGVWTSWYANGQMKLQGEYDQDTPTGKFTWWHENGQKSLEAHYQTGKKHGSWIWWHDNGLKSIQGSYANDTPVNNWLWWQESGKVAQRADFNDPKQRAVLAMPSNANPNAPSANLTRPSRLVK